MIVGFTGSRHGMSLQQQATLEKFLKEQGSFLHHGDCRGADEQAHAIGRRLGMWIVGHPPTSSGLRAFCECDEMREPAPFLVRDRSIVMETNILVAAPNTNQEQLRSGTWATIRIARRANLPHMIISPDGSARTFGLAETQQQMGLWGEGK